jgi:hypothetical protein
MSSRLITINPNVYGNNSLSKGSKLSSAGYYAITAGLVDDVTYGPITSGGWQTVDRPRQVAATQWFDRPPYKMDIEIILNNNVTKTLKQSNTKDPNFAPNKSQFGQSSAFYGPSVEQDCLQIESWTNAIPGLLEPPSLQLSGPIPGTQRTWIMYSQEFGVAVRDFNTGERIQQQIKMTLYEYNPPYGSATQRAKYSPAKSWTQNALTQNYTTFTTHIIKTGETINSIAGTGGRNYATQILKVNGIRDPSMIQFMVGETIILP